MGRGSVAKQVGVAKKQGSLTPGATRVAKKKAGRANAAGIGATQF